MNLLERAKHFFIPRPSNNQKAKVLHPSVLSMMVAVFLIYQFVINFYSLLAPSILGYASNIAPEQVIELTNQERLESGLMPLSINPKLNDAARRKAEDMFSYNYWSHNSPAGKTPWFFFREADYQYLYAGENLARDFMNSNSVVDAWMNSATHRDNVLNSSYNEIGLAVVDGTLNGVETTLVVQLFGTPTPTPVAREPAASAPLPQLGETTETEEQFSLIPTTLARANEGTAAMPLVSPFVLTKTLAMMLLGLIFGALVLDVILVSQKRIVRLSGPNLAHLIFITMLLLAVILTSQGAIL